MILKFSFHSSPKRHRHTGPRPSRSVSPTLNRWSFQGTQSPLRGEYRAFMVKEYSPGMFQSVNFGSQFPRARYLQSVFPPLTTRSSCQAEWSSLIGPDPFWYFALIGWDHSVATPALLCHKDKEPVQGSLIGVSKIINMSSCESLTSSGSLCCQDLPSPLPAGVREMRGLASYRQTLGVDIGQPL